MQPLADRYTPSPYERHNGRIGVRLSFVVSDSERKNSESLNLTSYKAYNRRASRNVDFRLKEGRGPGNEALISWDAMPHDWQMAFIDRFGNPHTSKNPLEEYYKVDGTAKRFFDNYRFEDGTFLKPDQIEKYTTNASVLTALSELKRAREVSRKMRGGSSKNIWASLIRDVVAFNDVLKRDYGTRHTLPESDKLKQKFSQFQKLSYASLIDGRNKNQNRQKVTPIMLSLWKDIYAGQRGTKPNHFKVYEIYQRFLAGQADIINNITGELYDKNDPEFRQVSEKTVYEYQTAWENKVATHALRSGNRQEFSGEYRPYHKMELPKYAGSIISIDDRQPAFKFGPGAGQRMWSYLSLDVGSDAITCWVFGDTKEGLILNFYEQLVRNYSAWEINLPYELECESSLNSSFKDTFLLPGNMFQEVHILPNNARAKIIERRFRDIRLILEAEIEGFRARPHAKYEANKPGPDKEIYLTKEQIVEIQRRVIFKWNNSLHPNQDLHPGMTRWQVFLKKQHPSIPATNWAGILPHLGNTQKSSMRAGRITLQGKHRLVGFDGQVALGEKLINVMRIIEGEEVIVKWLDDEKGEVLKAYVYTKEGHLVCELLDDLAYNRAKLEQTEQDLINRQIVSAYVATVDGYIKRESKKIDSVTIINQPITLPEEDVFVMPGLDLNFNSDFEADELPEIEPDETEALNPVERPFKTSTAARF